MPRPPRRGAGVACLYLLSNSLQAQCYGFNRTFSAGKTCSRASLVLYGGSLMPQACLQASMLKAWRRAHPAFACVRCCNASQAGFAVVRVSHAARAAHGLEGQGRALMTLVSSACSDAAASASTISACCAFAEAGIITKAAKAT